MLLTMHIKTLICKGMLGRVIDFMEDGWHATLAAQLFKWMNLNAKTDFPTRRSLTAELLNLNVRLQEAIAELDKILSK